MPKTNKLWRSLNHVVGVISKCDVILKCGDELFVGLCYDSEIAESPVVVCKGSWDFNYYLTKVAEMSGIICVDNQPLTRVLYEELKEGDVIPALYFHAVADIYLQLDKFKNPQVTTEFYEKLNKDVHKKIYILENKVYRKVERKFLKNKNIRIHIYEGDVTKYFLEELRKLAEDNMLNYRTLHNAAYKTDEFYFESCLEKYNIDFWQLIFISQQDKKIYVGSKTLFRLFDFSEADIVLGFVKALVKAWKEELWKYAQQFCEEFEINPRLYEIANNSIKTMVEINYNQNGYEYGLNFDTTCVMVYLKKKEDSKQSEKEIMIKAVTQILESELGERVSKEQKMYEILITYNEFLRHPDVFKNFLKTPKRLSKWNFWCKEKKYNQKMFDKKFQTIEQ